MGMVDAKGRLPSGDDVANPVADAQEIDFFELGRVLWRHKWILAPIMILCLGLATVFLHLAQFRYKAELVVSPADQQTSSKPTGVLASVSSLAGIDIGGQTGSTFLYYAEAVKSYPVAEMLSKDNRIMTTLFADSWDSKARQWHEPRSASRTILKFGKTVFGVPVLQWHAPDGRDLKRLMDTRIRVSDDKKKPTRVITFMHSDPGFCIYFLTRLNAVTDQFLRQRSLKRSSQYVAYLERRLDQVRVAEYRQSLAEAISGYERSRMMASAEAAFAAESFGDIWVSSRPVTPDPSVVLVVAFTAAILLWMLYVFVFRYVGQMARPATGSNAEDHRP
jgi:Chain length determinant protein